MFISLIVHFVQSKNAQARDPVTMRLLILAAPFFLIYAIESVAVDIIINVKTPVILDIDMLNLAGIISTRDPSPDTNLPANYHSDASIGE